MIYLASPYSDPDPRVRKERYNSAATLVATNFHQTIFSPIVYGHQLSQTFNLPTDAASWERFNTAMLEHAVGMWVLRIPGWDTSIGVRQEILYCHENGIAISHVNELGQFV